MISRNAKIAMMAACVALVIAAQPANALNMGRKVWIFVIITSPADEVLVGQLQTAMKMPDSSGLKAQYWNYATYEVVPFYGLYKQATLTDQSPTFDSIDKMTLRTLRSARGGRGGGRRRDDDMSDDIFIFVYPKSLNKQWDSFMSSKFGNIPIKPAGWADVQKGAAYAPPVGGSIIHEGSHSLSCGTWHSVGGVHLPDGGFYRYPGSSAYAWCGKEPVIPH